ncbi:hypothetical protein [Streptomyces sp. NPDC052107]|uniref:hypothetical protein n=1 Tax=Streptomyces sp. NPDC052107 TaxID=3155632 RepID=UPI00343FA766
MLADGRVPYAVETLRDLLVDTDSIYLLRRDLTEIWRRVELQRLVEPWQSNPPTTEAGDPISGEEMLEQLMKTRRVRLSRGQAVELQFALEEAGVYCDPALRFLTSGTDKVRIFRKWRDRASADQGRQTHRGSTRADLA